MANNIWDNSDGDNDGNNANNWSLGNVPTTGDTMYFDNTSDANCTFSGTVSCDAINVTSDYDGDIDFNDQNITTTGDMTFDGTGTVNCGTGTLECGGNFDCADQGTWNEETSTVKMTGASKTLNLGDGTHSVYNITFDGATVSAVGRLDITVGTCLVTNTSVLTIPDTKYLYMLNAADLQVTATGTNQVTGDGEIWVNATGTISQQGGTIDCDAIIVRAPTTTIALVAATYDCNITIGSVIGNKDFRWSAGTYTINGNLLYETDSGESLTIDCSTNNPNWNISGNVTWNARGGTITYNEGTGSITLTGAGSGTQTVDTENDSIEDLIVNDSGATKQISATGFTTDSLTLTAGTWDCVTNDPDLTINGDCVMDCTRVDMGDGTWTVAGNFDNDDVTTFNGDASTVKMTGASKTVHGQNLFNLTLDGATVTTTGSPFSLQGALTITNTSTLTIDSGDAIYMYGGTDSDVKITSTGTNKITGSGGLTIEDNASFSEQNGTIDVASLSIYNNHSGANTIVAAQYDCATFTIQKTGTVELQSGTYTFSGLFWVDDDGGTLVIDNSVSNPSFVFQGNVDIVQLSSLTWIKGTGSITLSGAGSGTQTFDFDNKYVEDITMNDSGATKQITGPGFQTDNLTLTAGTWDANSGFTVTNALVADCGQVNCGSGTWTLRKDVDIEDVTTWNEETARLAIGHSADQTCTVKLGTQTIYDLRFGGVEGGAACNFEVSGTPTITNQLRYSSGNMNNSVYNPSFVVEGDLNIYDLSPTFSYTRGTGSITLSGAGSGTQSLRAELRVEDIIVNDAGSTKQVVANSETDSLTVTAGTLDLQTYNFTSHGVSNITGKIIIGTSAGTGLTSAGIAINTGAEMDMQTDSKINNSSDLTIGTGVTWTNNHRGAYVQTASADYQNQSLVYWYDFTINEDATLTEKYAQSCYTGYGGSRNTTINGTLSIDSGKTACIGGSTGGSFVVGTNGDIAGAGSLRHEFHTGATITNNKSGAFSLTGNFQVQPSASFAGPNNDLLIPAWDFSNANVYIYDGTAGTPTRRFTSGTLKAKDYYITVNSSDLILDNATNNPSFDISEDVMFSESGQTVTYTKGTGSITLTGSSGTHTINFLDKDVESIVQNSAGATKQIQNDVTCTSFTAQSGEIDTNGKDITTSGGFAVQAGATVTVANLGGSTITVGGNGSFAGTAGTYLDINPASTWYFMVSGTGTAQYCNVKNSDASGSSLEITATFSLDEGGNTFWNFGDEPELSHIMEANMESIMRNVMSDILA